MLLMIGDYMVEVKAKRATEVSRHKNFNKEDTCLFLNWLSILAYEAADKYEMNGYDILARLARSASDQIYDALDVEGLYDKIREGVK